MIVLIILIVLLVIGIISYNYLDGEYEKQTGSDLAYIQGVIKLLKDEKIKWEIDIQHIHLMYDKYDDYNELSISRDTGAITGILYPKMYRKQKTEVKELARQIAEKSRIEFIQNKLVDLRGEN